MNIVYIIHTHTKYVYNIMCVHVYVSVFRKGEYYKKITEKTRKPLAYRGKLYEVLKT